MTGPANRAWMPRSGRSDAAIRAEQDRAAGGGHRRAIRTVSGQYVLGVVTLRRSTSSDRIFATLRWRHGGRSFSRSLGHVTQPTRLANLTEAWTRAHTQELANDVPLPPGSWASSPAVRASMRGNRGRDTTPELRLRKLLHARGLRYRVSTRPLPHWPRTADIVFPGARVAVFVDGCYWHGCVDHHRPATKNSTFWRAKIDETRRRDAETNQKLVNSGWIVIRCWEHDDPAEVADRVADALRRRTNNHRG